MKNMNQKQDENKQKRTQDLNHINSQNTQDQTQDNSRDRITPKRKSQRGYRQGKYIDSCRIDLNLLSLN